jgi:uncharacterized MAPEG superfamily protein
LHYDAPMITAYAFVLAAALLPYAFVTYAKVTPRFVKGDHNKNPREYEEELTGPRKRAYWAHLNGFEAFPPFAAAVIIAIQAGVATDRVEQLAGIFVACRVVHGLLYIANLDKLRTLAWVGGLASVIALFVMAAGS